MELCRRMAMPLQGTPPDGADHRPWDDGDHPALRAMTADPTPDQVTPDRLRRIYRYWLSARQPRQIPPTGALDPFAFARDALPYIGVIHVDHGAERLRVRLVGTGIVREAGMDFTGLDADQIPGAEAAHFRLRWSVRTGRPFIIAGPADWAIENYGNYRVLVLPFGAADGTVEKLMLVFDFF